MCNELLEDVRARATRIESRLVKIAQAMSIETGNPAKGLKLRGECSGVCVYVHTDSMSVNFSDIRNFLTKEGIEGKIALVYFEGCLVARIYPVGGES